MTEQEWLTSTNPTTMLEFLPGEPTDRKLRLFAVAWAHECYPHMEDERSSTAVGIAERYVEGEASKEELTAAFRDAHEVWKARLGDGWGNKRSSRCGRSNRGKQQSLTAAVSAKDAADPAWGFRQALRSVQIGAATEAGVKRSQLLRELFGNPFRPVRLEPSWLTSAVKQLATAIYEEKNFDDLLFLSDALEEAGCTSQGVLSHFRQPGQHVRGCWALDLVLGWE